MSTWNPENATQESDGYPDTAIVPYVEALNEAGIGTYQSCSGHQHSDGTKSDGILWLDGDSLTEEQARDIAGVDGVHSVCRRYAREDCWEVVFPGMADGEEALRENLRILFHTLGVEMP